MTQNEYIQALKQLPEDLKKKHGLKEPFDFTPYKCIHTDKYDYYPELECCVINGVPIQWENNGVDVNPENPEHFAAMKHISDMHQDVKYAVVYISDKDQKITCKLYRRKGMFNTEEKFKNNNFKNITFKNKLIYYDPNRIDLANNSIMLLLTKCLIYASIHNVECMIPEPNVPASEWLLW